MQRKLALILLCVCAHGAAALSVSLVPLQPNDVVPGQTVSFDVVFDWSSDPDLAVLGGAFDIFYDADALAFAGLATDFTGDPTLFHAPDVEPDVLTAWFVATLDGWPTTGHFGTVSFTVLDSMGPNTTLSMQDTPIGGPSWLCIDDTFCSFLPEYNEIVLSRVPVPAALWLFLGALAGLGSLRRARTAAAPAATRG